MYELLLRTETLFLGLEAPVLLAVGVGAIIVGLVFWLGGTRHSVVIIGLLGAVVGCAVGLLVGPWFTANPWLSMLLGAVVLGGLSILLRNVLIVMLAVLVFSTVGGAGYLSVLLDQAVPPAPSQAQQDEPRRGLQYFSGLAPADRLSYMEDLSKDAGTFAERLQALLANTWEAAHPQGWALILAVVAGAVMGILLVWLIAKIVIALAYSIVGTALIFLGVQAALVTVGILLVSDIGSRRWLLPVAFAVQTVVGWVWQLLHAGGKKPEKEPAQETSQAD
jgi:hypothetical protein